MTIRRVRFRGARTVSRGRVGLVQSSRVPVMRPVCILLCLLLPPAAAGGADGQATLARLEKLILSGDLPGGGQVVNRYASDRYPDAMLEFKTPAGTVIRAQLSERTAASNKEWLEEAWVALKDKPQNKARRISLGDGCLLHMYTSVAMGTVIQGEWQIAARVIPGPDRSDNAMDLAFALLQKMHARFQGLPDVFDIPEVRTFLGKDDPKTDAQRWKANLDGWASALARRVLAFPSVDLNGTISREGSYDWQIYLPGSAIFGLIGQSNRPSTLRETNVYARAAAPFEVRLRAKILDWNGRPLEPADVMLWALEVANGNYRLATVTAHNMLKEVTFLGRDAVIQAQRDRQENPRLYEKRLADGTYTTALREQNRIVSRLGSLRADPEAANDKMGPWYHIFAVLSAGAIAGGKNAREVVGLEHGMKWLGGFVNEGGFNREKYAIDDAFAIVAALKLDSSLIGTGARSVLRLKAETLAEVERLRQDPRYRRFEADLVENAAPDQREKIRRQLDDPLFQYEALCRLALMKRTPRDPAALAQDRAPARGGSYLGLQLADVLEVHGVQDGSPAARADLKTGDLIYSTTKGPSPDAAALVKLVSNLAPDEVLGVLACRRGEEFLTVIKPAAADASGQSPRLGVQVGQTVVVAEVLAGSPAAGAGLRRHDQILTMDGQPVTRKEDVREAAAAVAPGSRMEVTARRDGRAVVHPVVTGNAPDAGAAIETLPHGAQTYLARDCGAGFSVRMPYDAPLQAVRPVLIAGNLERGDPIAIHAGASPGGEATPEARLGQVLQLDQAQEQSLRRVRDGDMGIDGAAARWAEINLNYRDRDCTALVYDLRKAGRNYLWFAVVPQDDFAKHRDRLKALAQTFRVHDGR